MQVITDPQFNYLKGLIRKVGREFYLELRANANISPDLRERQLSKAQATKLIGRMVAEAEKREVVAAPLCGMGFEIETNYNTTMFAETNDELLGWANKRFKNDPHLLKKINLFLADDSASVDVPGYKIKRSE